MSLPKASINRAHILVITARSHAAEVLREVDVSKDVSTATTCLDTLVKQLALVEDVLCGNEGPLDDEVRSMSKTKRVSKAKRVSRPFRPNTTRAAYREPTARWADRMRRGLKDMPEGAALDRALEIVDNIDTFARRCPRLYELMTREPTQRSRWFERRLEERYKAAQS